MELSQRQDLSFRGDHADILRQEFEKMDRESYPPPSSPIKHQHARWGYSSDYSDPETDSESNCPLDFTDKSPMDKKDQNNCLEMSWSELQSCIPWWQSSSSTVAILTRRWARTHDLHKDKMSTPNWYIYTLLHELVCNITSYCKSGRGIFMSRRRVKMQPMSTMVAICMLTLCALNKRPIVRWTNIRTLVSGKQKVFCISILCQFVDLLVYYLQSKDELAVVYYRLTKLASEKCRFQTIQSIFGLCM